MAFVALVACGDTPATPSAELPGTWTLATANGAPAPNAVVHSGTITFSSGGTYDALTCYATSPAPCDGGRIEQGDYVVSGNTVTLTDGSYSRTLTRDGARLTQAGGGDTAPATLVYVK